MPVIMEKPSYPDTGIEDIDVQHRGILDQLQQLEAATVEQRTLLAVYVMSRLNRYTREHFDCEEALMQSCGYPGLEAHRQEHAEFLAKFESLLVKAIAQEVSIEVTHQLRDWMIDHIVRCDQEYVPYLPR
jgi:hemerythrin